MTWRTAFALLVASLAVACSDASGNTSDGDPRSNASTLPDGGSDASAADAACSDPNLDAGAGHGWSDLYRDYFGPTGKASCAGTSGCHGADTDRGAQASGFTCGHDVDACYTGITNPQAALVTVGDTTSDPTLTALYATLRKACPLGGTMPQQPADFVFRPADMKRITDWIRAGSPKN